MQQNKVLRLLSRLNPTEFKGFNRFLQSPYFNTNPRIVLFYEQLKKHYPAFETPKLQREKLFKKLFPGKAYHYQQLANLITELTRLTEEYFVQLELKADSFQQKKLLVQSFGKRNIFDLFDKETKELLKRKQNKAETINYNHNYLLLYNRYFHPLSETTKEEISLLKPIAQNLDNFYIQAKLLLAVELRNRENIFNESYLIPLIDEVKKLASQKENQPTIYFYYLLLELIETKEELSFIKLKNQFLNDSNHISETLNISIYRALNNFCLHQIREGELSYAEEHISLYQLGINKNLLLHNGTISTFSFLNAVTSGILCNKLDWLKTFIKTYQNFLSPLNKEDIMLMAKAYVGFAENNYQEVTILLNNFKSPISILNIISKTLVTRTYFEMFMKDDTYYDLFLSNLSSFEKYLQRSNEFTERRITDSKNFVSCIKKLSKLKYNQSIDKNNLLDLKKEINQIKPLSTLNWFNTVLSRMNIDTHPL